MKQAELCTADLPKTLSEMCRRLWQAFEAGRDHEHHRQDAPREGERMMGEKPAPREGERMVAEESGKCVDCGGEKCGYPPEERGDGCKRDWTPKSPEATKQHDECKP